MNKNISKYIPFMSWLIEVAEEKIIEHRELKKEFNSHEEFIIFTIVWMRVYKHLFQNLKKESQEDTCQENCKTIDHVIKDFYKNQNNVHLGITINAITRESLIPRSTVKRIIERLISKKLVKRNLNQLIIPTSKVRDTMQNYRQFIFRSNKKISNIFNEFDLKNKYEDDDNF